uniref:Lipoate--protein ligase family protein n=1 Tax=Fervidicoccus fontis TaxID=683846 RepID=A0A7J3ZLQ4_9CREN
MLRFIVAEWPENPFRNLAFEEAFYRHGLAGAWRAGVRFWRNSNAVIIGRLQCAALEVNAIECKRLGVKLVRRFTGGGAVYHDYGNLNYAIVLQRGEQGVRSLQEAFKLVGEVVASAIASMGVSRARYKPINDIEVEGLKISGLAATIDQERVFVHGSLLVSSDLAVLWRVLKVSREKLADKKFVGSRVKRVTTLSEQLGRSVGIEETIKAIADALSDRLGHSAEWMQPSKEELEETSRLYREKYARTEWNLKFLEHVKPYLSQEEIEALVEIAQP